MLPKADYRFIHQKSKYENKSKPTASTGEHGEEKARMHG